MKMNLETRFPKTPPRGNVLLMVLIMIAVSGFVRVQP